MHWIRCDDDDDDDKGTEVAIGNATEENSAANLSAIVAISKHIWAVILCSNKISQWVPANAN